MQEFFKKRISKFIAEHEKHRQKSNMLSILRGIAFITGVILLIQFLSLDLISLLYAAIATFSVFVLLINQHKKENYQSTYFRYLSEINQSEVDRLNFQLEKLENGEEYENPNHPYTGDLDVFGKNSLFQLINRCQIRDSKDRLSNWMQHKSNIKEISSRQTAVAELAENPDFMHHFQVITKMEVEKKKKNDPHVNQEDIIRWAKKTIKFSRHKLWLAITLFLVLVLVSCSGLYFIYGFSYHIFYLPLIINGIFLTVSIRYLNELKSGIDKSYALISSYQKAIGLIQSEMFASEKLNDLKNILLADHAYQAISHLSNLTYRLNARSNFLYGLLDITFLLDAFLLTDLYKWRLKHTRHINEWFGAVNEMECLISIAGFAHANPDYSLPEVSDQSFYFEAVNLGHPLIPSFQVVTNDYKISGEGSVDIITGSNMSGKSTFQRTVGVNMVLAQMGGPVMADHLKMSLTEIFTGMRTKDDLSENTSSFYAELKRIQQLLKHTENHPSTFFLLDEILKGTNSEDRHTGAVALTKKLNKKPAFGLISTHDLALGILEKSFENIRNYSFNSQIKGDEILFDYKLTPGVCKSFNASKLMEKMGIM